VVYSLQSVTLESILRPRTWRNFFMNMPAQSPIRLKVALQALCLALVGMSFQSLGLASDFSGKEADWEFKAGLDRQGFAENFARLTDEGFRIVDIETYRTGRVVSVSTIWTEMDAGDSWRIESSMPISDFLKAHEEHLEKGFSLVEFEVDRFGATLHFSGVWLERESGIDAEFYFGMESLDFSNRYGEMADRGYRLIDYEAYRANGKDKQAAVWLKNDGHELRFYRAIDKNRFGEIASLLDQGGYRLVDIEGYTHEDRFVFAGQWVARKQWQESQYAFDLLADEFYGKNAIYSGDGYRLTEFETYEDNGVLYYAGSWVRGSPEGYQENQAANATKNKKSLSLEAFRSSEE